MEVSQIKVLIIGGGRVGEETAKLLTARKHKVILIDQNMQRCETLSEDLGHEVFCGDATLPHTLEEAEIQDAEIFLAVTDDDKTNLLCAMLAKSYNVPKIYARIKEPKWIEACEKLGIEVINPAQILAYNIDSRLRGNEFLEFIEELTRDAEFKMIRIPPETQEEQTVIDFEQERHMHVVGILRHGTFIIPTSVEEKIKPTDTVACLNKRKGFHIF